MARTSRSISTSSGRRPSRPATGRAAARSRVIYDNEEGDDIENADGEQDEEGAPSGTQENMHDMISFLQGFQKCKAKQLSSRTASFQAEKKALFSAGRKNAADISRAGIAYIEEARARIADEYKPKESLPEKPLQNIIQTFKAHDEAVRSLVNIYPLLLDDLSPRRVEIIDAASATIESQTSDREKSRKKLLKAAKSDFLRGLDRQKTMLDAAELIRHYKDLMLID